MDAKDRRSISGERLQAEDALKCGGHTWQALEGSHRRGQWPGNLVTPDF
jgi:hypothetical protein